MLNPEADRRPTVEQILRTPQMIQSLEQFLGLAARHRLLSPEDIALLV
jgi:hypothetical protein